MSNPINTYDLSTNIDLTSFQSQLAHSFRMAKSEVLFGMFLSVKPEVVMIDLAKPESGRLLFWERVKALRPPSGVGLNTSERAECLCAAYMIDAPALKFRGTSHLKFRGSSLGSLCCDYSFARTLSAKPEVGEDCFVIILLNLGLRLGSSPLSL